MGSDIKQDFILAALPEFCSTSPLRKILALYSLTSSGDIKRIQLLYYPVSNKEKLKIQV